MFTYDYVLAAVLLTAPTETWNTIEVRGWHEPLHQAVAVLAIEAELLDAREIRFFLLQAQDFAGDLGTLQMRGQELAWAPQLDECRRFPDRQRVGEFLAFNRAYRQDLTTQLSLDLVHADELRSALLETDFLHHIWDTLRDARCEYYYISVRRLALQRLKDLLGPEAFYSGQMPPHVPIWRFEEMR